MSNVTIPASADGLPSRRAMIGALAAAPAMGLSALARTAIPQQACRPVEIWFQDEPSARHTSAIASQAIAEVWPAES